VLIGLTGNPVLDPLIRGYREWQVPVRFLQGASVGCLALFTYVFPNGRFVPRWTRIVAIVWVCWIALSPFTPFAVADFNGASVLWFGVLMPLSMGIGLGAQVYRYRRISDTSERLRVHSLWVAEFGDEHPTRGNPSCDDTNDRGGNGATAGMGGKH
jgi:hypothetical protein